MHQCLSSFSYLANRCLFMQLMLIKLERLCFVGNPIFCCFRLKWQVCPPKYLWTIINFGKHWNKKVVPLLISANTETKSLSRWLLCSHCTSRSRILQSNRCDYLSVSEKFALIIKAWFLHFWPFVTSEFPSQRACDTEFGFVISC